MSHHHPLRGLSRDHLFFCVCGCYFSVVLKVQVSLPRTLSSVVASQAVGRWSVDKVTVLTDGTAPSTKGGWPTTIAVSVYETRHIVDWACAHWHQYRRYP